jgi:Plasmid pRiA4b ORF-3-like protein
METIVTLKITLLGAKPPIWRRLEVPASYHLGELHNTLNAAMGWLDSHLHQFDIDGRKYSVSDDDIWDDVDAPLPEDSLVLAGLARAGVKPRDHEGFGVRDRQRTIVHLHRLVLR